MKWVGIFLFSEKVFVRWILFLPYRFVRTHQWNHLRLEFIWRNVLIYKFNIFKYILYLLIHLLFRRSSFLHVDLSSHLVSFFFSLNFINIFFLFLECRYAGDTFFQLFFLNVFILLLFLRNILNKYRILGWLMFFKGVIQFPSRLHYFWGEVCSHFYFTSLDMSFSSGYFYSFLFTYDL